MPLKFVETTPWIISSYFHQFGTPLLIFSRPNPTSPPPTLGSLGRFFSFPSASSPSCFPWPLSQAARPAQWRRGASSPLYYSKTSPYARFSDGPLWHSSYHAFSFSFVPALPFFSGGWCALCKVQWYITHNSTCPYTWYKSTRRTNFFYWTSAFTHNKLW
jgi:hypothetical protein